MALVLEEHGFTDVHPLIGGLDAWQKASLPVEPKGLAMKTSAAD